MDRIGPYEILGELGRGGLGVVYRARDTSLRREVAIKVVLNLQAEERVRFIDEARALVRVRDPGLVQVLHADLAGGHPYLVMDLVPGKSLDARLKRDPIELAEVARIGAEIVRTLGQLHAARVVHRDLKPANIILRSDGQPVLLDLGLALLLDRSSRLTRSGEMMGTPAYMSPEQAEGRTKDMGTATDVYGLGATLYALATGRPPFIGTTIVNVLHSVLSTTPEPPSSLRPEVSPELDQIILRCLAKKPLERPGLAEVREGLLALSRPRRVEGRLGSRRPSEPSQRPSASGASVRVAAVAAAVVGLCALGLVAAVLTGKPERSSRIEAPTEAKTSTAEVAQPQPESSTEMDDAHATPGSPEVRTGDASDWTESRDLPGLRAAADRGSSEAMNRLGVIYSRGEDVQQDSVEAMRWLRRAADAGNAAAMVNLATICVGPPEPDVDQAVRLYKQAALVGNTTAMGHLGALYSAEGARRSYTEAAHWIRMGAEAGDVPLMTLLGDIYSEGRGVPQDYSAAAAWYRKASEAGHPVGAASLGFLHFMGQGVPKDHHEAARLMRLAANAGIPSAMFNLGTLLRTGGQGMEPDAAEAARLFHRAAEAGDVSAIFSLAEMHAAGEGVDKDLAEAARWLRLAADAGHGPSMARLGHAYASGRGVPQDLAEAARWWQAALDHGEGSVRFPLGLAFYDGQGVARSVERARDLFALHTGPNAAYPALYSYLCALELDQGDAGRARLALFAQQRQLRGGLADLVAAMLGQRDQVELLQALKASEGTNPDVTFHLGALNIFNGDRTQGVALLQDCVATGLTSFVAHRSAKAMLERLEKQEGQR